MCGNSEMSADPRFATGAALITGGSGALGREIALELARAGSNVVLTYRRNRAAAEAAARAIHGFGREAEIASLEIEDEIAVTEVVATTIARFGVLHSVVYASGPALTLEPISRISPQKWSSVVNADVNGCFNLVHATLPHVREARGAYAAVITAAVERVPARDVLSAAPKAAVEMLFRGIAKEEGQHGVRANCIAPGWIAAGVGQHIMESELSREAMARTVKAIPLRRVGTAREVANAVVFLLSSRASYVNGQTLAVDGGMQV